VPNTVFSSRRVRRGNDAKGASALHQDLAEQIVMIAVKENMPSGAHLAEEGLAKRLRVSRSPVRSALKRLQERGIVEARTNRGFYLVEDGAALARRIQVKPESGADSIYDRILRDYVQGELSETVNESHLLARYEVGASELRTALLRLAEHGILSRSRGKGWHFEPGLATPEALEQSYRFRILVECGGLLEPSFRPDPQAFSRIRDAHTLFLDRLGENSAAEFFAINSDFHLTLAECSNNAFIQRAVENQNRLRKLHEFVSFPSLSIDRMKLSCTEHLEIIKALEDWDNDHASNLMKSHLSGSRRMYISV